MPAGSVTLRMVCVVSCGTQRAGRAGRLGPGAVYRCMDETSWARGLPNRSRRSERLMLPDLCWRRLRHSRPGFGFVDEPIPGRGSGATLFSLGALDAEADLSGPPPAQLPLSPRLGAALLSVRMRQAVEICALLEEDLRLPGADLAAGWRKAGAASPTWKQQVKRLESILRGLGGEPHGRERTTGVGGGA